MKEKIKRIELIANRGLINEDYHVEDLLENSKQTEQIDLELQIAENASITAFLGGYGTGKSTTLYHLSKKNSETELWVWFDAWKYPERQNLWEGFVLDFAQQVAPNDFQKVLQMLDGTSNDAGKTLLHTLGVAANIALPGSGAAIDKLAHFASTSPARRVFQIQDILTELINKSADRPIRIVIEDIDRSQDSGVYFLETLNNFLSTNIFTQEIKVIVPMSQERYDAEEESFSKCIHYVREYKPNLLLGKYVQALLSPDAYKMIADTGQTQLEPAEIAQQMAVFLNSYVKATNINFRTFKKMMRKWIKVFALMNTKYEVLDWRILLCAVTMEMKDKTQYARAGQKIVQITQEIPIGSPWGNYLAAIIADRSVYLDETGKIKFLLNGAIQIEPRRDQGLLPTLKKANSIEKGQLFLIPAEYFLILNE